MTDAIFTLSAFGDEIDNDLTMQLQTLRGLHVGGLELRGAWGVNVLKLSDEQVSAVRKLCDEYGVKVSCLGSPIGKTPILDSIEREETNLKRLFEIGRAVGTRRIRIFSFYPPDTSTNAGYDAYVDQSAARLARLTALAAKEDFLLLLENEKDIVTDTPERCHAVLEKVNSPCLRFAWDPANFVQVGVAGPMTRGWEMLKLYIAYIHVKDAVLTDGAVRPAGEGDGQVKELLIGLMDMGYRGVLALEPHLQIAGHSGGFSGAEGMKIAAAALRKLMAETGCQENCLTK
jgi:sugar phosphate isomerase/epimerase